MSEPEKKSTQERTVTLASDTLGQITVVVSSHLQVENLSLSVLVTFIDEVINKEGQYFLADGVELGLDLGLVQVGKSSIFVVHFILASSPGGAAGADYVLVGYREVVTLLDGEVAIALFHQHLHELTHVLVTFGSLGSPCHLDNGGAPATLVEGVEDSFVGVDVEGTHEYRAFYGHNNRSARIVSVFLSFFSQLDTAWFVFLFFCVFEHLKT